jgi:2-isopropylmalate synthase
VDAIYRAINRVIGEPNELIEFSVQAATEGIDAVGRVTIRIQAEDPVKENGSERRVFSGRGSDTDIVVASAKAYMFALNRLIAARREAEMSTNKSREHRTHRDEEEKDGSKESRSNGGSKSACPDAGAGAEEWERDVAKVH